jgi:hypothetical protein
MTISLCRREVANRRDAHRTRQGLLHHQSSQLAQSIQSQTWSCFVRQSTAIQRIKHPGGHRQSNAVFQLHDELLTAPISRPPDDIALAGVERMMAISDRYR